MSKFQHTTLGAVLTQALLLCLWLSPCMAHSPLPNQAPGQTIGTVNCTTSTCHGSITPWEGSNVLQNEYTTWSRLDKHAKAYTVLHNDRSKKMMQRLGSKQPAYESKMCLDCHAHNPPPAQRDARFSLSDGVSCEGCHGPAGKWVQSHTVNTHAENIAQGLYPTNQPIDQARLCLSCHLGSESKPMTHRIMGAGHPRLSFEMDTFSAIEPAHWRIDADWKKRKGDYDPMRVWSLGQLVAVEELLSALIDPKRGRDGMFPELALFDCHACHHPMSEDKYTARTGVGPGRIRLNDSNMLMLRAIVKAIIPAKSATLDESIAQLHEAVSGHADQNRDPIEQAKRVKAELPAISQFLEQHVWTNQDLQKTFSELIAQTSKDSYADYAGAEQAYMAVSSLAVSLEKRNALRSVDAVNKKLASLRRLLANDEKFKPKDFQKELSTLNQITLMSPAASSSALR